MNLTLLQGLWERYRKAKDEWEDATDTVKYSLAKEGWVVVSGMYRIVYKGACDDRGTPCLKGVEVYRDGEKLPITKDQKRFLEEVWKHDIQRLAPQLYEEAPWAEDPFA